MYKQASFNYDNRYFEFVPLIIVSPDNKVYKEEKEVASFLDISPTVLYSSGVKANLNSDGKNLLDHNSNSNQIPFCKGIYDRKVLFDSFTQQNMSLDNTNIDNTENQINN
jgi:hypothetical protein